MYLRCILAAIIITSDVLNAILMAITLEMLPAVPLRNMLNYQILFSKNLNCHLFASQSYLAAKETIIEATSLNFFSVNQSERPIEIV